MPYIVADRIKETSTTTGTGNFSLAGAATGYRAFDDVMANGDTCYYVIQLQGGSEWEVGYGTFNDTDTLVRTRVTASSNAGAAVNFSSGTKDVFMDWSVSSLHPIDGWIPDHDTWVYVSAVSFKIEGVDRTAKFPIGTRVSYNDGSVDFGVVAKAVFSTDTTVTLFTQNEYSIANATLTAPRYSYLEVPADFPVMWTWSPTLVGWSNNPTNTRYSYTVHMGTEHSDEAICDFMFRQTTAGTSSATAHSATYPGGMQAATGTQYAWLGMGQTTDNNVVQYGFAATSSAGTTFNLAGNGTNSANTSSGVSRFTTVPCTNIPIETA